MRTAEDGRGVINVLQATELFNQPTLYSTVLLSLLSELYEVLPEVGDLDKPKMVFFFDEAHVLFKDAPKVLLEKIELIVRLIRSKGVGVFFVTQNPTDIPDSVAPSWATVSSMVFAPLHQKSSKQLRLLLKPSVKKVGRIWLRSFRSYKWGSCCVYPSSRRHTKLCGSGFDLSTKEYAGNGRAERPLVCHQQLSFDGKIC